MTPKSADMSRHITVNLDYPGLKLVHQDPPVFTVQNFFDPATCEKFLTLGPDGEETEASLRVDSATFGGGATASNRQSTTWFLRYDAATPLLTRVLKLLPDLQLEQCEEPQIVRYEMGDFFNWHEDKIPDTLLENGGQRVATLLVYLNDVAESGGGATTFQDLNLKVQPEKGKALLFFPAFSNGEPDARTIHAGSPAFDTKWIAQMWVHQFAYKPAVPSGNAHAPAAAAMQAADGSK